MGVRKGCFQCSKRRVRCDMGEPRCEKCINRGLPCSGNGIRYRFTNSVASRGKLTGSSMPVAMPAAKRRATQDINPLLVVSKSQAMEETDQVSNARNEANYAIRPYLNQLDGPTRLLFNYFSTRICPGMVIVDGDCNGYRNLILPLAVQDGLVRQAVASVAACHLHRADSNQLGTALIDRAKVVRKLRSMCEPNYVFSVSTWTTLLVLLVGELASGGDQYPYLVRLLSYLRSHAVMDSSNSIQQFLALQTDLIFFLAQPFTQGHCDTVVNILAEDSLQHVVMGSMGSTLSPANQEIAAVVVEAATIGWQIYANSSWQSENSSLDRLVRVVSELPPSVAGGASLVWVYFIAAIVSRRADHRDFFINRLADIHELSGWENIPAGLAMLRQIGQGSDGPCFGLPAERCLAQAMSLRIMKAIHDNA